MKKIDIYQIKKQEDGFPKYAFRRFEIAEREGLSFRDYEKVYQSRTTVKLPDNELLQLIFEKLYSYPPEDYKGRKSSVSDIIRLDNKFYYCDSVGWKDITYMITQDLPTELQVSMSSIKDESDDIEVDIEDYLNSVYHEYPKSFDYEITESGYVILTNIEWKRSISCEDE